MESIRTYTGLIYLCTSCGQPCYEGTPDAEYSTLLQHFKEQWDGIYCATFPLAFKKIEVDWLRMSLDDLKRRYPDTYPVGPRATT